MEKISDEFIMKHKTNKVNLFRQTQKANKNLSISTTTTSNSQNRPNEKLLKKNSLASTNTNDNELNDTLLEEYLETEGKRILTKLSESLQTTKNGHIIINSKKLLTKEKDPFDSMRSDQRRTKISKNKCRNRRIHFKCKKSWNKYDRANNEFSTSRQENICAKRCNIMC